MSPCCTLKKQTRTALLLLQHVFSHWSTSGMLATEFIDLTTRFVYVSGWLALTLRRDGCFLAAWYQVMLMTNVQTSLPIKHHKLVVDCQLRCFDKLK